MIKNIFFLVIIFPMKVKSVILFSSVYSTFKSKNQFLIILVLTFDKLSVIYLVSYETKFCFELRIILKNEKMGVVSKTRQQFRFRICSRMENLTFVLKTTKGFNTKRTLFMILMLKNSLKFGIVVLVMRNKMLVIVFSIDFYSKYGPRS